jgi:antitoxin VapB
VNIAQISTRGTHQVVVLPDNIQLAGSEVYVKKVGNVVVLISTENLWQLLFDSLDQFSDDFMKERTQPPLASRETEVNP